jgi:endothelin-converting enzyme/putative endopeptidase
MRSRIHALTALVLTASALLASCHGSRGKAPPKPAEENPPGIVDETALDRKVDACEDFYQFACGGWIAKTEIPSDRPAWVRSFSVLHEDNQAALRKILEADAAAPKPNLDDPYAQKLGDFYATCMDEAKAENASLQALTDEMGRINTVKDAGDIAKEVAHLHDQGVGALFRFGSQQDFKDATQMIAFADQGGLGLPDRDYYLKNDAKSVEIRNEYMKHITKMLELLGTAPGNATTQARNIMSLERYLAKVSLPRVDRRDPHKIYHRLERAGLQTRAPRFLWPVYLEARGHADVQAINVAVPEFMSGLNDLLARLKLADLRAYLRWQLVHSSAPALGKKFVDEDFRFRSKTLSGEKENLARWKRCVDATDAMMGEALARPYIKDYFAADAKARVNDMIQHVEQAFDKGLVTLDWMDDATKKDAKEKLKNIANEVGYPNKWRDYDKLDIDRVSYLGNLLRARTFENRRKLDRIGKPVDRGEWGFTPPTVNAEYEASLNRMEFPAGILQPPFWNRNAGKATNYGGAGMVMGHELTHGFDDEGKQFDAVGNLRDWWTPPVAKAFNDRAECVAKQYDGYTVLGDVHLNGHLTLGENIADIGGLKTAFAALHAARAGQPPAPKVAGFDEQQQFFIAFAQAWCGKYRDEYSRMLVTVDPHSPPQYRVNGTLTDTPEFAAAFQCKPGAKMAPQNRCTVW